MIKAFQDIYFYNAKALACELRDNSVSEYRAVKHMVAAIIIGGIGFELPITVSPEATETDLLTVTRYIVFFIITSIISFYGAWLTHQVNHKGDGNDYFLRFAVLSLPVGVQLLVLYLWVGLALVALSFPILSTLGGVGASIIMLLLSIATFAFYIMFFLRMRRYIAIAAGLHD